MARDIFHAAPVWVVFGFTVLIILLAMELGVQYGRWRRARGFEEPASALGVGSGAILGLVSFLLAFTFGTAASHNETRRALVLEEANAIGTAYLRMDLLPDSAATEGQALLKEYAQMRYDAAVGKVGIERYRELKVAAEAIHAALWQSVVGIANANPTPTNGLVIASVNELIDLHAIRLQLSIGNRLPMAVWVSIYLTSCLGVAAAAYVMSANSQRRPELMFALVFAFSSVITMIADLDNPRSGFLQTDQTPLRETLQSMG